MKKIILLTMAILSINSVTASVDSTLKSIDTASVTNKIYNDVKSGIVGLASGLKVGAEHVYEILVKQQIVNSGIYCTLLFFGLILIYNYLKRYNTEKWTESGDPTFLGIIRFFQLILGAILFIISIFNIDVILTGIINPEYGAIKEILTFIK